MTVIVPHLTEELKLIEYSKDLISHLCDVFPDFIFFRHYPLYISLNDETLSKEELKQAAREIKKITVFPPVFDFSTQTIQLPVSVETSLQQSLNLPLIHLLERKTPEDYNFLNDELNNYLEKKSAASELFPMQLKIFRLAQKVQINETTSALSDFVWQKIK